MNIDTSDYYPKSHLDDEAEISSPLTPSVGIEEEFKSDDTPEFKEPIEEEEPEKEQNRHPAITMCANIISWIFVPMLMPVYGIMLAFGLTLLTFTGLGVKLTFTAITAAFNLLIPAIIILMLKRLGIIKDIGLNAREERIIPFLVSVICLIGTAIFMSYKAAPEWLVMFFFGGAAAGIVESIVNRWWKISVHAAGIAGIVALLIYIITFLYTTPISITWLMIALGVAGLLGASRIWLGRHTLWQVMAGYVVGFCSVFFIMMI